MRSIAIGTTATKGFTYAMEAQARMVQANVRSFKKKVELHIILVGDKAAEGEVDDFAKVCNLYRELLPEAKIHERRIVDRLDSTLENYSRNAQLLIAQLRTDMVSVARALDVDYLWSLDADVLPPHNALRTSFDSVSWDDGYYDVSCGLYPSQGDGPWLCGRGTYYRRIASNLLTEELAVPPKVEEKIKHLLALKSMHTRGEMGEHGDKDHWHWIHRRLNLWAEWADKHCPPKEDIWGTNSKGRWRQRGWFDYAYPGIGKGAMVPTDWCGMGCTFMTRRAYSMLDWNGYTGAGTEDLFVIWERWFLNNIRIVALPHILATHVIRIKGKDKYVAVSGWHEFEGEYVGHIRKHHRGFYQHSPGETYIEANDGVVDHEQPSTGNRKRRPVPFEMGKQFKEVVHQVPVAPPKRERNRKRTNPPEDR